MTISNRGPQGASKTWHIGLTAVLASASMGFAGASHAAGPEQVLTPAAQAQYLAANKVDTSKWTPRLLSKPPLVKGGVLNLSRPRNLISGPGLTVPYWTTAITSPVDNQTYTVSMVGSSPYDAHPANTNVIYVPVVIRIHLKGFVLDPTAPGQCDAQSASRRFFNSPLFRPTTFDSNGVNVSNVPGGTQLISAYQRANFWNAVKGTGYGVTLIPSQLTPIVVDWFPTNPSDRVVGVPSNCGGPSTPVPLVEIDEFDNELQAIAATYAKPNQIPVALALDTAIYIGNTGNCCVLGYHNAVPVAGGTQLYATGAYYDTDSVFGPHFADTTIWVHELGELIDDPFVQSIPGAPGGFDNDLTPNWGPTGQVFGCQNNLENGDPLTPDQVGNFGNFPVAGVGGFVYHYQDLAFHDWFYRTASSSAGGKYSFKGYFNTSAGPICH